MKKITPILIVLLLFSHVSFSQSWLKYLPKDKKSSKSYNFFNYQKAFYKYLEKEGKPPYGYKQFKRYEYFMKYRVDKNGYIPVDKYWQAYQFNQKAKKKQRSLTASWSNLGPNTVATRISDGKSVGIGRINCISFDPTDDNVIYIGAPSGGLWKTTNGGTTWQTTTDDLMSIGIADIAIDPDNPEHVYISTGDANTLSTAYSIGVLKSTDGGTSWNTTGLSLGTDLQILSRRLVMNPKNSSMHLLATNKGITKTENSWNTYRITTNGDYKDIEFRPGDSTTVYATSFDYFGGSARIFKSTDAGESFSPVFSDDGIVRIELAVTPDNPDLVYAVCSNTSGGLHSVQKSTDAGENWTEIADSEPNLLSRDSYGNNPDQSGGQGFYDLTIIANPTNEDEVYVGGINLWKSTDGGQTWEYNAHYNFLNNIPRVHADQHGLTYDSQGNLYVGNDGGIYKTTNNGVSWNDISEGLGILQIYKMGISQSDPNAYITGTQDNGTLYHTNTGSTYEWKGVYGGDGMECFIDPANPDIIYATVYDGNLNRSTNGGSTFTDITPDGENDNGDWVTPFLMSENTSKTLYAGYTKIYKTTNRGVTWTAISPELVPQNGQIRLTSIAIAPSNSNFIYTASGAHSLLDVTSNIWFTNSGGTTNPDKWLSRTGGLPYDARITHITVSDHNPLYVWVTLANYNDENVYFSKDAGKTWMNYSNGLPAVPANCMTYVKNSNDAVFVGTDIGVYYRDASMDSWENYSDELPNAIVTDLEIHETTEKLRAATYGRGVWETPLRLIPAFTADQLEVYPESNISFNDKSTGSPVSWTWEFEGAETTTYNTQNPADVYYPTKGTYDVTLTIEDASGNISSTTKEDYIVVTENVNIPKLKENDIKVYPNPSQSKVYLELADINATECDISVYDKSGKSIQKITTAQLSGNKIEIDFSTHTQGLYLIEIQYKGQSITKKVTIRK